MVIWYKLQLHISYKKLWSRIFSCFYNVRNKKLDIRSTWYKRQQLTVPSRPLYRVCTVVITIFSPPQIRGKFVQKYEILKFGQIQFFTPDEVGFPRGCSFLRLWGSYNACLAKLGWNHHLFHEISHLMLFHIREDWLKTIKFVQKYEILKFPQLEFSWIVNKTS